MKIILPHPNWGRESISTMELLLLDDQNPAQNQASRTWELELYAQCWLRDQLEKAGVELAVSSKKGDTSEEDTHHILGPYDPEDLLDPDIFSGTNIEKPATTPYDAFLAQPRYPVVAKHRFASGGRWKFLLENDAQTEKFATYLQALKKNGITGGENFVFQDFIQTPSHYSTSYRVLVGATGTVFASSMLYNDTMGAAIADDDPFRALSDPNSQFFLASRFQASNGVQGGKTIPLTPARYPKYLDENEEKILNQHGIDPKTHALPSNMAEAAGRIGRRIATKTDLVLGVDFIQDRTGKTWYLETNKGPESTTYLCAHGRGFGRHLPRLEAYQGLMIEALHEIGIELPAPFPWRRKPAWRNY